MHRTWTQERLLQETQNVHDQVLDVIGNLRLIQLTLALQHGPAEVR